MNLGNSLNIPALFHVIIFLGVFDLFFRIFLLLVLVFSPGFTNNLVDRQRELQNIQAQIQRNQRLLQQTRVQENASLRDLAQLNRSLARVQSELNQNQQRLIRQAEELQKTVTSLARNEAEYKRRQALTKARIREMYKSQDAGWLTLLLTNRSFSSLVENTYYYRRILERDLENIRQVQSIRKETAQKKTELEYQRNIMESTKKSIEQQKTIYEQRTRRQEQVNAELRAQRLRYERESDTLLRNSKEIEEMIKKMLLENPSAEARGTGTYVWPLRGQITSRFGMRFHPIFKVNRMHTGIDIYAPQGTPIKAADAGIVTYSDWYGGYGRTIIIDHGRGLSTLYAHLSRQTVKKGDRVNKGQTIGNVGSTGYSTGPHLHFEVRRNGAPVDPQTFLPK